MREFVIWAWSLIERYIKFSLVGVVGAIINFSLLYVLTNNVGLWYLLSATIAIMIAGVNNYILNHLWTFRGKEYVKGSVVIGCIKYLFTVGVTEILYLTLVYLFCTVVGIYYMLSAFIALMLTTGIRYAVAEKWIWRSYKRKRGLEVEEEEIII